MIKTSKTERAQINAIIREIVQDETHFDCTSIKPMAVGSAVRQVLETGCPFSVLGRMITQGEVYRVLSSSEPIPLGWYLVANISPANVKNFGVGLLGEPFFKDDHQKGEMEHLNHAQKLFDAGKPLEMVEYLRNVIANCPGFLYTEEFKLITQSKMGGFIIDAPEDAIPPCDPAHLTRLVTISQVKTDK